MQSKKVREKSKETNMKNLGVPYPMQSKEVREKSKETCLEKYNVSNVMQSEVVKEKHKKTCKENLGVEYVMQSKEVREKSKETNIKNLGVPYPAQSEIVKEKMKATCLEKLGVENPFQSEIIKNKAKETCKIKYNVEYNMQCPEIAEKQLKSCYTTKNYTLPSDKIIKIQGYENHALDELLYIENIEEDDIISSRTEVPEIWYCNNGKNHKYYTDIYIISQNKCIEVKSTYTSEYDKDIIKLKEEATIKLGYEYELRIYDRKGNRI